MEKQPVSFSDVLRRASRLFDVLGQAEADGIITAHFGTTLSYRVAEMPTSWPIFVQYVDDLLRAAPPSIPSLTDMAGIVCGGVPTKTPTLDKLENTRDPVRAPLPGYGQRTPFDRFAGFTTRRGGFLQTGGAAFAGLTLDGCAQFKAPKAL